MASDSSVGSAKRKVEAAFGVPDDLIFGAAPPTPLANPSVVLMCLRCGEETTFADSWPNSTRNPLKRIDKGCSSVEKCLNRRCGAAKAKKGEDKSEQVLKSEAEHKALREKIKNMTEGDRQQWYKDEKHKRAQEDEMTKRTLTDTCATIKQTAEKAMEKRDRDMLG